MANHSVMNAVVNIENITTECADRTIVRLALTVPDYSLTEFQCVTGTSITAGSTDT